MADKKSVKAAIWLTAAIVFLGVGYLGYRFIQDVSRSAAQIESQVEPAQASGVLINDATLNSENQTVFSGSLADLQPAEMGVSNGQDVVIQAGELVYTHGVPQVHLALVNQGSFAVGRVYVRLSLYLEGNKQSVGEPVVMMNQLPAALLAGDKTTLILTVPNPNWRERVVAEAKTRRVVAQIVGVGESERADLDYPQTSASVLLRQTANDWSKPNNPNDSMGVSLRETASQAWMPSPNIRVQSEQQPENLQRMKAEDPDDISEFLEKPLPTGEPRILSVEVQEFKDGELQTNSADKQ